MTTIKFATLGAALLFTTAATAAPFSSIQTPIVQEELHGSYDASMGDFETLDGAHVAYCESCFDGDCSQQAGSGCNCPACAAKKAGAPNPCATSHKPLFFDNNFSYLKDPDYHGHCLGDCLKLMPVDRCGRFGTLDIGGQLRLRYHHEQGMGQQAGATRFENTTNDFMLTRLRLYTNWQVTENVRFYMENIFAYVTADAAYIPRPIDQNFGDFLNLFADVKLTEGNTLRVGRQELLYGAQRTVSPLDWANTRRTFQGVKLMNRTDDWATDLFYTNYVPPVANELDEADYDVSLYGCYSVYSGFEKSTVDFYYLGYDNQTDGTPVATDFSLHTLGMRLNGSHGDWLYEFEGAPQFGRQIGLGLDQMAGFATAGIGRKLDMAWAPTLWFYYDYASGNAPGGDFNRCNQIFPLAHKYLGFIDATQRSNIESPNLLLTMQPREKISLLFWYYHLMANQASDIVPSIGGTPDQSLTSKDWGDEVDFIMTYAAGPSSNLLIGYSHFWAGNKITPPGGASDADFVYTQWEVNF